MKRFYEHITSHPKLIITIFVIASAISAVLGQLVSVNYDMNDYLPSDSKSTISLDVMQEEFSGGIPNCRVMIENVTIPEALKYKDKFEKVKKKNDWGT